MYFKIYNFILNDFSRFSKWIIRGKIVAPVNIWQEEQKIQIKHTFLHMQLKCTISDIFYEAEICNM